MARGQGRKWPSYEYCLARAPKAHGGDHPDGLMRDVAKMLAQEPLFLDPDEETLVDRIAVMTHTPRSLAKKLLLDISASQSSKLKKQLAEEIKRFENWKFGQFLYLPTYRKRERSTFIELIEFGMEDVERIIQARMAQIKERVRTSLSKTHWDLLKRGHQGLPG